MNKEDCLRAQEAISRAADGDSVTVEEAAWAKHHCAECAECATYVRTLARMRAVATPTISEEALSRVIAAGTALIEADQAAEMARAAEAAEGSVAASGAEAGAATAGTLETPALGDAHGIAEQHQDSAEPTGRVSPIRRPRPSTQSIIGWSVAVAAVLIAAMFVTAQGLRTINNPTESTLAGEPSTTQRSLESADTNEDYAPSDSDSLGVVKSTAPGYVVFDGSVYRFTGIVTVTLDDYEKAGATRTALDTGGTPQQRTVYDDEAANRILIEGNGVYAFEPVTRTYENNTYVMRSDSVDAFGDWPQMPSGIPVPTQSNGRPTFEEYGQSGSITIYVLPGREPEDGFAVAPLSPATDPAQSNPEWTWWELKE